MGKERQKEKKDGKKRKTIQSKERGDEDTLEIKKWKRSKSKKKQRKNHNGVKQEKRKC